MLLSHFNRELEKTAIIFKFRGESFSNLGKLLLDRTFPLPLMAFLPIAAIALVSFASQHSLGLTAPFGNFIVTLPIQE